MPKRAMILPVIASPDEGVQIIEGRRFGVVGGGYQLAGFETLVGALAKLSRVTPVVAVSMEDDWLAEKMKTTNGNLFRENVEKWAGEQGFEFAGQVDFGDPKPLRDERVVAHLVRPPQVHVADEICLTVGGGEGQFSLRQAVISADFLAAVSESDGEALLRPQIEFYRRVLGTRAKLVIADDGGWDEKVVGDNKKRLQAILDRLSL